MPISQMLLPEFDAEMASTRKTLERVPDDKFDYKPHEKSMTLGRLAGHIAELPGWGTMTMNTETFNLDPAQYAPYVAKSRDELLKTFDRNVAETREQMAAANDDAFLKSWTLTVNGQQVMQLPRVAVIRSMVFSHIIHHRAQLGVYLRLNNVEVPGVYGPSADEPNMFSSQAASR